MGILFCALWPLILTVAYLQVLCYVGGSTRGILHHLRSIHSDVIDGIIQPVIKKRLTPVGGIDINDDEAWVQEFDDEDTGNITDSYAGQASEYQGHVCYWCAIYHSLSDFDRV